MALHIGDKNEAVVTENREVILHPDSRKVDDVFCKLHKTARKPVSIEAMDEAITHQVRNLNII